MEKFAEHTIRGSGLDSFDRDPPPRCHPGTRQEIINQMELWINGSRRRKKMSCLVGPAGVGKSAIMQSVAERSQSPSTVLAALFFSAPNKRNDPSKVVTTLAYQICSPV